jgi:UDP-glucose 4-epimerase
MSGLHRNDHGRAFMNKTALVTGAHGFIGRHVARLLAQRGYTVTGIGHGAWGADETRDFGITFWHTADVTLDTLMTYAGKPAVIVHCAGSGSVPFSMEQPHQDYSRTVSNTAAVLEYVRLHSPDSVVVYPSSAAVYGNVAKVPIEEDDALQPASPYGVHKLMAESLCRSYGTHFGLSVAIVRFFSVYGEGLRKQLLWDACRKAQRGERAFHGTGAEVRDWLHVEDAAALLLAAAERASPDCPTFNGGTGEGRDIASVLARLFEALGQSVVPSFNGVGRSGDPSRYVADMTQTHTLAWTPATPLDDGLQRYAAWYREIA